MPAPPQPPLRRHQREALTALDDAFARGRTRAWIELPPGAGKTRVGLECAKSLLAQARISRVVVLGPNTAIQGQWISQAEAMGFHASVHRSLSAELTALTYQSLAVFDPEPADEGAPGEITRLHANGQALLQALCDAGPLLLILDECHHLLEVWGRLLDEVLAQLPHAVVLGLTATPPEALTREQAALVDSLFGTIAYATTVPAVVKEGDLAPFAELVWLTTPTPTEQDWLAEERVRFAELIAELSDHRRGSTGFLPWLTQRFVTTDDDLPSPAHDDSELADAVLRLHHVGLIEAPDNLTPEERHRREPSVRDWGLLISDWAQHSLRTSTDPRDAEALSWLRETLPAVGLRLTRHGVRPGRSITDRVLSRSQAKTDACVEIAAAEAANLGPDLRLLVLCDHEAATPTATVATDPTPRAAGSARALLLALLADSVTASLSPLMVTGRTVAGSALTLQRLSASLPEPLAASLTLRFADDGLCELVGRWTPRRWVPAVTEFFTRGDSRLLVGTRALLGEGWDAQCITTLVDLTTATSLAAVTQLRGRSMRLDPQRPGKVALTWTVTCVAPGAPNGDNDWDRLVRKTTGFFGLDDDGVVSDGISSIDPSFSPYAPPAASEFDAVNARMLARGENRPAIAAAWRVGQPYADRPARVLRIRPRAGTRPDLGAPADRPSVMITPAGWRLHHDRVPRLREVSLWLLAIVLLGSAVVTDHSRVAAGLASAAVAALVLSTLSLARHGAALLEAAARPPSLGHYGSAVADALVACELIGSAAEVRVDPWSGGEYRCYVSGVSERDSAVFAAALAELVAPITSPRYLISRQVITRTHGLGRRLGAGVGSTRPEHEIWHQVPSILAVNATRAGAFAAAWRHWVADGELLYAGNPEGAGVLAAQRGSDPTDVTCVMRRQWT